MRFFDKETLRARCNPLLCCIDAGPSQKTEDAQIGISKQQLQLATEEHRDAQKLRSITEPGLRKAEDWYTTLASGDPDAIMRVINPDVEGMNRAAEQQKANIADEMPAGGEKRLAMENIDAQKAGQVGKMVTGAHTAAFPALAQLAGTGIGLSINEMANALTGLSGASATMANVGQQEAAGKAATMGFLGSLASAGGQMGAAAMTGGASAACWVAEAVFGVDDARTKLLRWYLNHEWEYTFIGALVMPLYRRYGKQLAPRVKKSRTLTTFFRFLFNRALTPAAKNYPWWTPVAGGLDA